MTFEDNLFRERIRERDLDNFLVEELFASSEFLVWFIAKLGEAFVAPTGLSVLLHKSPPREQDRRQTDVRIGWFDEAQELRACILIESKVTADFQVGQATAYAEEIISLRDRLGKRAASALLVAPSARMASLVHDGSFDGEIAIEEIIEFLSKRALGADHCETALRLTARIQLLEALCGKRASAGWIGETIPEKRDFAEAYAALAAKIVPDLTVRPSSDGPKAITRIFERVAIDGLPPMTLRHEFGSGTGSKYANVLFRGMADRLPNLRKSELLSGTPYSAEEAGKSVAIRVATPAVDPMRPFEEQSDAVERGLIAIRDLVAWLRSHSSLLSDILKMDAGPPLTHIPSDAEFTEELMNTYRECERLRSAQLPTSTVPSNLRSSPRTNSRGSRHPGSSVIPKDTPPSPRRVAVGRPPDPTA